MIKSNIENRRSRTCQRVSSCAESCQSGVHEDGHQEKRTPCGVTTNASAPNKARLPRTSRRDKGATRRIVRNKANSARRLPQVLCRKGVTFDPVMLRNKANSGPGARDCGLKSTRALRCASSIGCERAKQSQSLAQCEAQSLRAKQSQCVPPTLRDTPLRAWRRALKGNASRRHYEWGTPAKQSQLPGVPPCETKPVCRIHPLCETKPIGPQRAPVGHPARSLRSERAKQSQFERTARPSRRRCEGGDTGAPAEPSEVATGAGIGRWNAWPDSL